MPWGLPGYDWRWSPFALHFPGVGCSGTLHSARSCRCSNSCHRSGSKWPLGCQGKQDTPALRLLPRRRVLSEFTPSTSRSLAGGGGWSCPPTLGAAGYLRGLVGHHHALPSCHGVVHVLGEVVAFHADEVAGRGRLPCKRDPRVRDRGRTGGSSRARGDGSTHRR